MFGKDWKKVQEYVGTRSSTQARSHAQKVLPKLEESMSIPSPVSRKNSIRSEAMAPEEDTSLVFKVEKDKNRINARKRLFSAADTAA